MVGSELKPTQGKRGGKPGDIGASSSPPPLVTPSLRSKLFREYFARFFTLVPRSLLRNRTKTLAPAVKSPLFFSTGQFFARALQSESLEQQVTLSPSSLELAPGSVVSYFCQEPSDGLLPLLVRLFVFTGFCHILRLGSFVVCSCPIRITLECKQVVPFSLRQSPLSALLRLQL